MKIILILTFLFSGQVEAKTSDYAPIGKCLMSFPMQMFIVKKIDSKIYELKVGSAVLSSHAVIETLSEKTKGRLNTGVKYLGSKNLKLEDGFDTEVDLWQECKVAPPQPIILHDTPAFPL